MKKYTNIAAEELLTFSTGEYSDYSVHGVFRALKNFSVADTMREFLQAITSDNTLDDFYQNTIKEWFEDGENLEGPYIGNEAQYLGWLSRHGFIEGVPSREIHLGSYGRLSIKHFE